MEKKSSSKKRKTKYNHKWENNYSWIMADLSNENSANCKICNVTFSVAFGGNSNILQHMKTEKHKNNLRENQEFSSLKTDNFNIKSNADLFCRICLQKESNKISLISVFDCDDNNTKIAKKIYDISGIFINNTDSLPNKICYKCNEILSISYNFRIKCQKSDIQLKIQVNNDIHLEEVKFELSSHVESEPLDDCFAIEKEWISDKIYKEDLKESVTNKENDVKLQNLTECNHDDNNQTSDQRIENKKNCSVRRFCRFRSIWMEKFDFIKEGKNDTHVYCKVCECEFSIAYGGEAVILKHMARDKHYYNLNPLKKGEKISSGTRIKCAQSIEELNFIICEVCGNKFPSKRHLRRHIKYHSDIKEHECEICKKQFRELMHLSRHMRVHTGEKPYACKYCSKRYGDYSSKVKHERVHTNERPYVCQTCGKAFMISDTLNKHIMTHTGEKPFCCDICNVKFSRKTHLQAHFQSMTHKNRVEKANLEINI